MQENFIFRRINIHTDLNQITDLIELCFGQQLDPDGKRYLQYLRNISNEPEKLDSSVFFTFQNTPLLDGYVCEEKGKIIGNVTLSSYTSENKKICFISNVAVSPAARNMGIATRLMKIAPRIKNTKAYGYKCAERIQLPIIFIQAWDLPVGHVEPHGSSRTLINTSKPILLSRSLPGELRTGISKKIGY